MAHDFYDLTLEQQLTCYDDGFNGVNIIGEMLHVAKQESIRVTNYVSLYDYMNTNLIWLGVALSFDKDYVLPVFGNQTVEGGHIQSARQTIMELATRVQLAMFGINTGIPCEIYDIDSHWRGIYENGCEPIVKHVWYSEMVFTAVKETELKSYERRTMDYDQFLETNYWIAKHYEIEFRYGNKCALCNKQGKLQLHHRTYDRRGHEFEHDLIPLCRECHQMFHEYSELVKGE